MVIYDHWSGHLNMVITPLNRSLGQYIRNYTEIKIGITNNPETRFNQHIKLKKWDRMIVKYETSSLNYVRTLEQLLVENYFDYISNEVGGGGGNFGNPPYYLYVLIRQ